MNNKEQLENKIWWRLWKTCNITILIILILFSAGFGYASYNMTNANMNFQEYERSSQLIENRIKNKLPINLLSLEYQTYIGKQILKYTLNQLDGEY